MIFQNIEKAHQKELAELFTSVFTSSEGKAEGKLIGQLASELASNIEDEEIICLGVYENGKIIGSTFYSFLRFNDPIKVYMLAPVAVQTEHQGKGVGQALISYGLNQLKKRRVNVAITYAINRGTLVAITLQHIDK